MSDNNNWSTNYPPVDINTVKTVENKWGIRFPSEYISFITNYHGGEPTKRTLNIGEKEVAFSYFLTFIAFDELDILDVYNEQKGNLPPKHFPFAMDKESNLFCFNFNDTRQPSIVYVETISSSEPSVYNVASNFTEFVQQFN
ncbi:MULTISPECIES: SMI1/KNR4 family protein [unclassified Paenibacillus]|uniref:SMI1/KNR4 family protein n=1 Tax=unclassified Paenibacillus TaxID=185978 RepID=UPI0013E385DE|nr:MULTISPECIES: SMI1/KNR4 family protein [unclassified Paenibacillus]MCM3173640.1 SMI1/KNR4 family protein [Paenibacillus sp. MER 99-2]